MKHAADPNPINAIKQEVEKAKRAPKKRGIFPVKKANDWIKDSRERPDPRTFFHGLIVEYECTIIFASSVVGKSIYVPQIAEDIVWKEPLLFIDLELADKQFQMRYTDPESNEIHMFPDNFERAEIDPELIVGEDLEEAILDSIEEAAKKGTRFFVLDNITFACNDSEKGATAGAFMMNIIRLKKKYHLTTIVIAHTPKRRGYEPITQNDLAGSAKLINFFDAGIAIARSAKAPNLRYVKQVKVHTGEYLYDAENVLIYDVNKVNGFLKFEFREYGREVDHLKTPSKDFELEEIQDILKLQAQGKSLRAIANEPDMSLGMVQRRLKKAALLNITVSDYLQQNATEEELNSGADIADVLIRRQKENDLPPVSDVSAVSHTIQPIQQIQGNPIMQEIRKYISPEYCAEVAVLIEDFDLVPVSIQRINPTENEDSDR